nr:hypothetical protein [Desulfobacterales bacterium]
MLTISQNSIFTRGISPEVSKVIPLKEAIQRYVRPGMVIHTCQTGVRWCSAIYYEIARQFWGQEGIFTLVGISMNFPQSILVHGRMVKKVITTYCGDPYYTPSPNPVFQRAFQEGSLEIENWSILTLPLRLKAAALGLPYLPTRSLIGSDMARENKAYFKVVHDPFSPGNEVGLVKALQPDLSIIHAWLADPEGNAIFLPPLVENLYGAMASREGVLLTVEKIVSVDVIREYSHLTKLPGIYVKSVSEVPFGAHPSGLSRVGMREMDLYAEDYEFVEEVHQKSKDPKELQAWIEEWVLSCRNHQEYLRKLGYRRILQLKGESHLDSWRFDIKSIEDLPRTEAYTPLEMAVIVMSRKLAERVQKEKYRTMLAGAGIANLAAWLCYYRLKEEGYPLELMAEIGLYGYEPRPMDPSIFNQRNFPTCKMVTDTHTLMGVLMGGENNRCIGVLGAAEVDRFGNINSTKISQKRFIVGSGGANDIASSAREAMVIVLQSRKRLKDKVFYITSPGRNVSTVVSTMGVFEKLKGDSTLSLTGYFRMDDSPPEATIEEIRSNCGWDLNVSPDVVEIEKPTVKELEMLRVFDPHRYYLGPRPKS